eukprot:617975-Pyramimonas_sp.AAC.1
MSVNGSDGMDAAELRTEAVCELGCTRCGYNWCTMHWNSGSPTIHWGKYCNCCGGTQGQQDVCKYVCTGRTTPHPTPYPT